MIVDCHYHVFRPWIGACGHTSRGAHIKFLQKVISTTPAHTFRARDGAPADAKALFKDGDTSWDGLTEVDFRVGKYGMLEFTVDGEEYYCHYMPVGMQEITAPPEMALAQLAYVGVDHAILHGGGIYGAMNDYNAFAQNQWPDRFTGLMHINDPLGGSPEILAEVDRAYHQLGLRGIYFNMDGFARYGFPWPLDDARMEPLWEKLNSLKMVVVAELSAGPRTDAAGYTDNLTRLGGIMKRFPDLSWHLSMSPPIQFYARDGKWDFPPEVLEIYRRDDVWIEITYPISWGGVYDYPYPELRALIKDARDQLGAERLIWGSDMPNVERFCTFKQSLDYVLRYCDFLSDDEKDLFLGANAARLYNLKERAIRPDPLRMP